MRASASSISSAVTISGGSSRTVVGPVALSTSRSSSSARRTRPGASVGVERDHQPAPAHVAARPAAPRSRSRSRSPSSRTRASSAGSSARRRRRCAAARDERAAGERRAVVARLEDVGEPLAGHERADRQAAAERLRGRERVGHDARLLVRPQRAGAPHAASGSRRRRARRRRGRRPRARRAAAPRESACTPVSPWIGSSSTAAVPSSTAASSAAGSRRDDDEARARAARTAPAWTPAAWRDSAPYVRPWKAPCTTTISPPGFALRTSFSAASFASAPELQKKTLPPSEDSRQPLREPHRRLGVEEVRRRA